MELYLTKGIATFLLPPGGNLLLAFLGLFLLIRYRAAGMVVLLVSVLSLYGFSTPMVADALSRRLESVSPYPLRAPGADAAQAIVVLGGGRNEFAPQYGGETVSAESLERVRYAARLQRKTDLPILVAGGQPFGDTVGEAILMKRVLVEDFKVPVKWVEDKSRTTHENAVNAAKLLKQEDVQRVFVVTHAAHVPRAVAAFERQGLQVIGAPTGYRKSAGSSRGVLVVLPSAGALNQTASVMHEYLGAVWYRWRYE